MIITHFFPGTLAFTDSVIRLFDKTGYSNWYYCVTAEDDGRGTAYAKERTSCISIQDIERLCADSDSDVFIFHALPSLFYNSVLAIPKNRIVIASSWGYDLYDSQNGCPPICPVSLYKPYTQSIVDEMEKNRQRRIRKESGPLRTILRPIVHFILQGHYRNKQLHSLQQQKLVLSRINYWATVLPVEFEMIKSNPSVKAAFCPFKYSISLSTYPISEPENGNYILLGNSASLTNNHCDVIRVLLDRGISYPLHIPAAYGNSEYLKELELRLPALGVEYHLQKEFIPSSRYCKMVSACKVAVFGHIRQQALGNICLCLFFGKKVFLWKDSLSYLFLKGLGCHIFSIDEDLNTQAIESPLTKAQIQKNQELIKLWTSDDYILYQTKVFLDGLAFSLYGQR